MKKKSKAGITWVTRDSNGKTKETWDPIKEGGLEMKIGKFLSKLIDNALR